ncbi:DUF4251 domain-containing protein [Flaviramulus sp. BrNp1-15]|uniref:DUF4251 domain-containing protein n=1 Tax=Flaviramulus sp. BrNp1-15 TaxID=2916754 RepID=UPI001EE8B8D9|nr:DUF4251 domain-containing protein [Flaviramulus sp. BrNp1-15]ULC58170.1 DUF4251 domain-containing protein [Flaviramulus sp. BrNp1-15]
MKTSKYIIGLVLLTIFSCGTAKNRATQSEIEALNKLVENKQFTIESNWAYPQATRAMQQVLNSGLLPPGSNSGGINLIGNPNFLRISGDSITSYLPYFGERQMQVNYGGRDGAIEFEGIMENYESEINKDGSHNIKFNAASNSENFTVYIKLWPKLKSDIVLNSPSRFTIRYSGSAKPITD